jgi:hypothetical protein
MGAQLPSSFSMVLPINQRMQNKILFWLVFGIITQASSFAQTPTPVGTVGEPTEVTGKLKRQAGRDIDADWTQSRNDILQEIVDYQIADQKLNFIDFKIQKNAQDQLAVQKELDAANLALANKGIKDNERRLATTQANNATLKLTQLKSDQANLLTQKGQISVKSDPKTFLTEFESTKADKLERLNNQKDIPARFKKRVQNDNYSALFTEAKRQTADQLATTYSSQDAQDLANWRQKNIRSPDSIPLAPVAEKKVVVVAPVVPDSNHLLCANWNGKDATAGEQYACDLGGVKIGAAALALVTGTNISDLPVVAKDNPIFKAFLARTAPQTCDDAGIKTACESLGTALSKKVIVMYDSCSVEGDDAKQSAPLLSAKEFCQGPMGADGKTVTAFASLLGFSAPNTPPEPMVADVNCDQVYVELAKLVLSKPENSKILSMMIHSAASKMAALAHDSGSGKKKGANGTMETYSQDPTLKAAYTDFETKLTNSYLGTSGDIQKVLAKVNGTANYFDASAKSGDLKTRFSNSDASAFILYLSKTQGSNFTTSDAAAIWAQGQLFENQKMHYGVYNEKKKQHDNLLNFSNQVYLMNQGLLRAPASGGDTPEMMIQKAVTEQFTPANGTVGIPEATLSKCLKNETTACSKAATTIGSESLEKIREKVSILASTKELEGLNKKLYKFAVKSVTVNSADGSYSTDLSVAETTKPAQ